MNIYLYICFCVLCAGVLPAQERYSFDSLVELAMRHDYGIKRLEQESLKSVEEYNATRAARLPTLSANWWNGLSNGRYYDPISNQFTQMRSYINSGGITASWDIYNGGYINIKSDYDQLESQIDQLNLLQQKIALRKTVLDLYVTIAHELKLLELCDQKIDLYTKEILRQEQLLKSRRITYADMAVLKSEKSDFDQLRLSLKFHVDKALGHLSLLTDRNIAIDQIVLPYELEPDIAGDRNSLIALYTDSARIMDSSVNYLMKQLELQKAGLNTDLQKAASRLKIKLEAGVYTGYSTNRQFTNPETNVIDRSPLLTQFQDNLFESVTLNFYLPLYNKKNKVMQRQNRIEEKITEINRNEISENLLLRFEMSQKQLLSSYDQWKFAQERWHEEQEIMRSFEERAVAKRLRIQELFEAKKQFVESHKDYYAAYFAFYRALGDFEIDYGGEFHY